MRAAFSLFATFACAAFTYAAPIQADVNALNVADVHADVPVPLPVNAKVDANVAGVAKAHVATRDCDCTTIPNIIVDLTESLKPLAVQLNSLTVENCTLSIVEPIVNDIKGVLSTAISDVQGLVGQPVGTLLKTVDSVLSVTDVLGLVGTLLQIVFGAVSAVLKLVHGLADEGAICKLLGEVLTLVGQLLQLVTGIVGGLLNLLLPLLTPVLSIITQLGVTQAFSGLGLPL
ncbi:hypothetical protein K435DRAFT_806280 [Dendrothele bispora CBS 962.96]|uniref:Uncharacterized protein n=1 Tax=Dendrothele bispora (strain CBS 962.96) TaxID=1314807 RepID=A0A4S8L8F2_DENBC|nr:hypothetical protein K435DRAFT_806280 [Dendrothele bispora CBS 962.96]